MKQQISLFQKVTDTKPKQNYSITDVLKFIKNNYDNVEYVQQFIRVSKDKKEATEFKKQLPAVTFSGTFSKRNKESLVEHSNIICIDIDDCTSPQNFKETFTKDAHVLAAFISPSGKGLKLLFRIDGTQHEASFKSIETYIKNIHKIEIDTSGKDVCRLCFLAHDEDIYINENAKIFRLIPNEPPLHAKPLPASKPLKKNVVPKNEVSILDKCLEISLKTSNPTEGSLNHFIGVFANQTNRYGLPALDAIDFLSQYARPDHDVNEITKEVEYIYKKNSTEHGKYNTKTGTIYDLNNVKKPINTYSNSKHETPTTFNNDIVFWYETIETNKTTNETKKVYKFSYNKAVEFLQKNGFFKYYLSDGKYQLIQCDFDNNIVEIVSELRIKEFMFDFLKSNNSEEYYEVREMFRRGIKMYANTNVFDGLDYFYPIFKRDTQTSSFAYFKNCFLEITSQAIVKRDYSEQEAFIWKKQIVDVEYKHVADNNCDFNRFINLAMIGEKKHMTEYDEMEIKKYESICTTIGYMLHSYKNPALTKAVIAVDRNKRMSSLESNGGTGKSLFSKAIGKMINMTIIDGANLKFDYEFAFQQCNVDTALVNFNDVNKNFDFTRLFGMITEEFSFAKKGKDAITLSFADSPKIYISTNQSMRGDGNSHSRRQQIIEFSDYFIKVDPIEEFKHRFFYDWDASEWTAFYSFMVDCIQKFLQDGLIAFPIENYEHNKLVDMAGEEFIDHMNEHFCNDEGEFINVGRVNATELFKAYQIKIPAMSKLKMNTFGKYVKLWARVMNLELNAHRPRLANGEYDRDKSGSEIFFTFTKKAI
jgi:VirE N-terminal domain